MIYLFFFFLCGLCVFVFQSVGMLFFSFPLLKHFLIANLIKDHETSAFKVK